MQRASKCCIKPHIHIATVGLVVEKAATKEENNHRKLLAAILSSLPVKAVLSSGPLAQTGSSEVLPAFESSCLFLLQEMYAFFVAGQSAETCCCFHQHQVKPQHCCVWPKNKPTNVECKPARPTLLAMASSLLAMASNLSYSTGLQPDSIPPVCVPKP